MTMVILNTLFSFSCLFLCSVMFILAKLGRAQIWRGCRIQRPNSGIKNRPKILSSLNPLDFLQILKLARLLQYPRDGDFFVMWGILANSYLWLCEILEKTFYLSDKHRVDSEKKYVWWEWVVSDHGFPFQP